MKIRNWCIVSFDTTKRLASTHSAVLIMLETDLRTNDLEVLEVLTRNLSTNYYPSMRGGKTCVPACRSCSPPQQNQPWLRGVENLGMENLTLKLFLHCVSSSTDSCLASNTTIRCRHVRQPCLGQPRTR
jgi:hypothetical protein